MANIKNFGIAGVSADVQMGKSGGRVVYDSGNTLFKFTESDGTTLAKLRVADPSGSYDVVTKGYLDGVTAGLDVRGSVRVASTAAGALANDYENGDTMDGITLATGDRILLKDQASGSENGIYTVNASGAPTRATDFDENSEVQGGAFTFVEEGSVNSDRGFVMTNDGAVTVGTTALTFTQYSGAGMITAGSGMTKSSNTLNVIGGTGITANADDIAIDTAWAGQTAITTLGTVATGTWNGSVIDETYGGLGGDFSGSTGALIVSGGTASAGTVGVSMGGTGATSLTDNAILTGTGTSAVTAETNFTFDGSTLALTGAMDVTGDLDVDNVKINGATITTTSGNLNLTLTPHGTGSVAISKADIDGGAIDGTAIGAASASTGAFTTINTSGAATLTSVDIDGGSIDGTNIGAASAGTGAFTTVTASTSVSTDTISEVTGAAGVTIDGIKLKDSIVYSDTIAEKTAANGVQIDGATIKDNTFKGNVTVEAGETIDVSAGTLTLANDQISGNSIQGGTIGSVTITTLTGGGSFTGDVDVSSDTFTLAADQISGDKVHGGTISNFASTGIDDNGTGNAITIDSSNNVATSGNLTVGGDLTISGSNNTINTATLTVEDPLSLLSSGATGSASVDAGFIVERGDDANVGWLWDESADEFAFVNTADTATTAGNVTIASYAKIHADDAHFGGNLTMSNGYIDFTAAGDIKMLDNNASALDITEAGNSYLAFVTTNGSEKIVLGKKLEAGAVEIEGSNFDITGGSIDNVIIGGTTAVAGNFTDISGTLTTASQTNITSIGTIATGAWEATDVGVAHGGTGSSTASGARTNLGVAIGSDVQAYDADLAALAALSNSDSNFIVGSAAGWVAESGATARTSLGVGTGDSPQFTGIEVGHATDTTLARSGAGDLSIEGNVIYRAGGTDVPVTDGGTGSSTASGARSNLGLGNVENTALSTWAGTTNVTTLGTIATGTWNGTAIADAYVANDLTISGGTVDNSVIGGTTAAAGSFTTLTASNTATFNGNTVIGNASTDEVTITAGVKSNLLPLTDAVYNLGSSTKEWGDLFIDGTANIDSLVADTANIDGGNIDGTAIGAASASTAVFTDLTSTGITDTASTGTGLTIDGDNDVVIANNLDVSGDATVTGSLTVNGTLTSISTTNTEIEDNLIFLNKGESGAGVTNTFAGITVDRGSSADAHMAYDDGQDRWEFLSGHDTIGSAALSAVAFGTIEAATWNGTAIGAAYGGTGIDSSSSTGAVRVDGGTWSVGDVSLTADVSGTLPIANGGTAQTSLDDIVAGSSKISVSGGAGTVIGGDATLDVVEANLTLSSLGGNLALASQVSGTLPVANGGTGVTSGTSGQVLYWSNASTIAGKYQSTLENSSGVTIFDVASATTSGSGEGLKLTNAAGKIYVRTTNTAASGDVDLYLGAQGSGDVIVEGTGNGVVKGDDDLDLTVRGGDADSAHAGDLILSGGSGTGAYNSGNVYIQGGLGGAANGTVQMRDSSGNEVMTFSETAAAVNYLKVTNAATGSTPAIDASGDDTNISLYLNPKGTGVVNVPASYKDRADFDDDSLVTKEYVDGVSSTETFARRGSLTLTNSEFNVGAVIDSNTTNYVTQVIVAVTTALAGGSIDSIRLHDGTNYLTAVGDVDATEAGTFVIDLPATTATAAGAQLVAKCVASDGTTASTPTSGAVAVTIRYAQV